MTADKVLSPQGLKRTLDFIRDKSGEHSKYSHAKEAQIQNIQNSHEWLEKEVTDLIKRVHRAENKLWAAEKRFKENTKVKDIVNALELACIYGLEDKYSGQLLFSSTKDEMAYFIKKAKELFNAKIQNDD